MAMKKVIYDPENMMLKHVLRMHDKDNLLGYARDLEIKKISKLRKEDLVDKIVSKLLDPSVMKRRLGVLAPECRTLMERAIEEPFVPAEEEMEDALCLQEYDYALLDEGNRLKVPVDVKAAYKKLNTPEFQEYACKMSWLSQCLNFAEFFYGVFDKDVLYEMFDSRQEFHISQEEFEDLCGEYPSDMTECYLEKGQAVIFARYLLFDDRYEDLLAIQMDKDYYVPSSQQILDYARNLYLSQEPAYENFRNYLHDEIGMTYQEAEEEALGMWDKIQFGVGFGDTLQYLMEDYEDRLDEAKIEKVTQLMQELNNNTRLQMHRGHTPNEIMKMELERKRFWRRSGRVRQDTRAFGGLQSAPGKIKERKADAQPGGSVAVFPDYLAQREASGQTDSSSKKIYPNDLCPCGSGKKYKKCCGKLDKGGTHG